MMMWAWAAAVAAATGSGVFDVRDYGAKGDGVAVDSPAINAAIDAAHAAGGGTVRLDLQAQAPAGAPTLVLKTVKDVTVSDSFGIVSERIENAESRALPGAAGPAPAPGEAPWTSLFDGQTLTGWRKYGGPATFEVKDGAIVGTFVMDDGGRESTYLATEKELGDFDLELEFKADAGVNAGVQFRSFYDQATRGKVQGYQFEIDDPRRTDRPDLTGGIYDQSRRGWLVPTREGHAAWRTSRVQARTEEWSQLRVECRGPKIRTFLNGKPMAELDDDMTLRGFVALQVHQTRDAGVVGKTVSWRNIRIREVD